MGGMDKPMTSIFSPRLSLHTSIDVHIGKRKRVFSVFFNHSVIENQRTFSKLFEILLHPIIITNVECKFTGQICEIANVP